MKMKTQILTTALTLSLAAGAAWAEVPESVADRLGKDLTPMGAEKVKARVFRSQSPRSRSSACSAERERDDGEQPVSEEDRAE